jgi:preprotein translocase subunit SecA
MLKSFTKLLGGDPIRRQLESYAPSVEAINALEPQMRELSDEALKAKTEEFRSRLAGGETLDDLLHETFAVVREVSVRTVGLRHFDVQLIGAIVLHEGKIIEMRTGEGKTLVATMPIYLNALEGKGVHLVTVNDYLARRDARWMGPIFHFLGLSVGVLQEAARTEHGRKAFLYDPEKTALQEDVHQLVLVDRKQAYAADVTYGTNNEFGFDYLRDNMARSFDARSQRGHHYAILDEVDNILIDEARTPLIISGPSHEDPERYVEMAKVVRQLKAEDFEVSERDRNIALTEIGEDHVERVLGMPLRDPDRPEDITPEQARTLGHLEQALRAEHLFKRNKEYVVQGGRVIIVDQFTGRMMPGRRWSDGLHQAVEAKEGVAVRQENVTYATITLQNYFRKYAKLAGMTGTAVTEAEEFNKIYNVDVLPLPTNLEYVAMQPDTDLVEVEYAETGSKFSYFARPDDESKHPVFWRRKDYLDVVYRTEEAKFRAQIMDILARTVRGQPLLVGTTSVELSERLSKRLGADMLQRLALVTLLRDAYMVAHNIPDEGVRIDEFEPLYQPLEKVGPPLMRPMARELDLSLNPTRPENLQRLAEIMGLEESHIERLSEVLRGGIAHRVLNAKKHDEESRIIAGAGALGAVTIATNMAGRGVDIKLGGEIAEEVLAAVNRILRRSGVPDPELLNMEERLEALANADDQAIGIYDSELALFRKYMEDGKLVKEVGGLHVIGSERHESRRIDNQLRGRAARQGDPGSSQFFLSLEDELMRLFGGSRVSSLMQVFRVDDMVPIARKVISKTIEGAQTRVEGANFDTRKHLLEYDDVLNQQREVFYGQRDRVLSKDDLAVDLGEMLSAETERHVQEAVDDPEGPWKLLAWLEETQPTISLQSETPYPSFMLGLLLEELRDANDPASLKEKLLGMAARALETQHEHLARSADDQLARVVERMKEQVSQRVEMAEMAIDGALLETEETGAEIDANALLRSVESAAGMRIQVDQDGMRSIRDDVDRFRKSVPQMVEVSLGVRVWAGLVQAIERRIGESLGLEPKLPVPIDWDEAAGRLQDALANVWMARSEKALADIGRELDNTLGNAAGIDDALKLKLLIELSYGRREYFDRKTHQRRIVRVPRLSYPFMAADLLDARDSQQLLARIQDHLDGAASAQKLSLGRSEIIRLGGNRLDQLEPRWQGLLRDRIGPDVYERISQADSISALPDDLKEQLALGLGHILLTEAHRSLFLSVADRAWIDYLTQMEALRTSIGLEAYGQRDPLVQYKSRAFDMFQQLLTQIRAGLVSRMFRVMPPSQAQPGTAPAARQPGAADGTSSEAPKSRRKRRGRRR